MKRRILSIILTLSIVLSLLLTMMLTAAAAETMTISTPEELASFRDRVNGGETDLNATLTADFTLSGTWTPIGTVDNPYIGTFDGGGYEITGLSITSVDSGGCAGLFGSVGTGGTVRNVGVEGSIAVQIGNISVPSTISLYMGGIAAVNSGTVENCYIEGSIYCSGTLTLGGDGSAVIFTAGGLVGENTGTVSNCYSTTNKPSLAISVSGGGGNPQCEKSEYAGGVVGSNSGTVTNCYYRQDKANSGIGRDNGGAAGQAEGKTEAQFTSGEVAWLLQNGQTTQFWGQTPGTGSPELTGDSGKTVYRVTFDFPHKFKYDVYRYLNYNGTVGDLPDDDTWRTGDGAEFTAATPVTADIVLVSDGEAGPDGDGTPDSPYLIPDLETLKLFRDYVNGGPGGSECFELTQDIELDGDWASVNSFPGVFDGGGHTISNLSGSSGLFGSSSGTVRNLGVEGAISGSGTVGGVVVWNSGRVENCSYAGSVTGLYYNAVAGGVVGNNSGTVINCSNTGDARTGSMGGTAGGIVGINNSGGTVGNCYNFGSASCGDVANYAGGVVGNNSGTVSNCYSSGSADAEYSGGVTGSNDGTVTNCYYDKDKYTYEDTTQGVTGKTPEEFASGEVAWLLQNGQGAGSGQVWGQTVGSGYPELIGDSGKMVCQVIFYYADGETDDEYHYVNSGGTIDVPADPTREGYQFVGWYTDSGFTSAFDGVVTGDTTVYARWLGIYTITVAEAEHGSVTAAEEALEGETVTLTVTPDAGFELDTLTVTYGSETITPSGSGNTYTFIMPAADVTVEAVFMAPPEPLDVEIKVIKTAHSITVTSPTGSDYEYAVGSGAWQTGPVLDGLSAGTTYTVRVRQLLAGGSSYGVAEKDVTTTAENGATVLKPGESVVTKSGAAIANDGAAVTAGGTEITLPAGRDEVEVDANGDVTVPDGSTVVPPAAVTPPAIVVSGGNAAKVNSGGTITLPSGGRVKVGGVTVTVPAGGVLDPDDAGDVSIPGGSVAEGVTVPMEGGVIINRG